MAQAASATHLAYLAYEYAPLSLVTGLYGMSDGFAPGGKPS
jgi:Mg2+ and Co2+ transporter CorA